MRDKIIKLPKWARDYISKLEYQVSGLAQENEALTGKVPKSNTYYRLWTSQKFTKHYLPESANLTVIGNKTEVSMFVDHKGVIRVDIGYGLIMPIARNSIYIVPEAP